MTHALVLGAGVSGMSVARLARSKGYSVTIYDEAPTVAPLAEGFGFSSGKWDHLLLRDADMVITSPGFPERSAPIVDALEWGMPLVSEIEFASLHIQSPLVAITGTNGKTSVTEATSSMLTSSGLDAPTTGNIGVPLSDFTDRRYDALVCEVSSFQLRFTETFHPVAAALTNVAEDHLDWHGSFYAYRDAKAKIFANQTAGDILVYDAEDPGASSLAETAPGTIYPVSGTRIPPGGGGVEDGMIKVMDLVIDIADLQVSDPTYLTNIACAAALSRHVGGTPEGILKGAASFFPGPHRRRKVAEHNGVVWVDDSKATNPHSVLISITSFDSVILIAGGLAKGLDLSELGKPANVKAAIGIGQAGPVVAESAGERGHLAGTMEVAVEMAARLAEPGDTVLLAPGCASFDQFDSYAARGDRFTELVLERTGGRDDR